MGDHRLFDPFSETVDRTRFTYAFLDSRGYGTRRAETGSMSIEAVARDLVSCADYLGWTRFNIVGHSMGGMVAQRLMVDIPTRLESAILIAPVPASGAKIDRARQALLLRSIKEPAARRDLIDVNTGKKREAKWLDRLLNLSLRSTSPESLAAYMHAWTSTDFLSEAQGSVVPVLLIVGDLDPSASVERVQQTFLRWYPNAKLQKMKGVGHYPMQEEPRDLVLLLEGYLGRAQ